MHDTQPIAVMVLTPHQNSIAALPLLCMCMCMCMCVCVCVKCENVCVVSVFAPITEIAFMLTTYLGMHIITVLQPHKFATAAHAALSPSCVQV
jgi:hypothetical protein